MEEERGGGCGVGDGRGETWQLWRGEVVVVEREWERDGRGGVCGGGKKRLWRREEALVLAIIEYGIDRGNGCGCGESCVCCRGEVLQKTMVIAVGRDGDCGGGD